MKKEHVNMKKLPTHLFVSLREAGTDNEYLFSTNNLEDFDDGEIFGRFERTSLERLERAVTTHRVVEKNLSKRKR
jgi:hypothetical protein